MSEPRLDGAQWRMFRLFLMGLEDDQLDHVRRQLQCEIKHRRDSEADFTRLFFTSLHATDLETAQQTIDAERLARVRDRRRLRGSNAPTRRC